MSIQNCTALPAPRTLHIFSTASWLPFDTGPSAGYRREDVQTIFQRFMIIKKFPPEMTFFIRWQRFFLCLEVNRQELINLRPMLSYIVGKL